MSILDTGAYKLPSWTGGRPAILVIGATGAQGGSVARHLLARGRFAVRALTRRPESPAARELARRGVDVAEGSLDDRASLRRALAGCYGVFGVTDFWEHFEREADHGRNLVNAVAGSEVEHLVFSSLPHVAEITAGALSVPHFDQKAETAEYARDLDLPMTAVEVAFYYENFLGGLAPRPRPDGALGFGFPQGETRLAAVAVEDAGGVVAAIFERPEEFLGRTVGVVGDDRPPAGYAETLGRVLGRPVVYEHVPREVYAGFGFPGAEELAAMFEFNRTRIPSRQADLDESRALWPAIQDFDAWAERNRARLEAAVAAAAAPPR